MSHNFETSQFISKFIDSKKKKIYIFALKQPRLVFSRVQTVYKVIMKSSLNYGVLVQDTVNKSNLNKLQKYQNIVLRLILNKSHDCHVKFLYS